MEAAELKNFSVEELKSRIRQWRDELFRSKFKSESSEAKDTSIFKKLRRDIARANTVLTEKAGSWHGRSPRFGAQGSGASSRQGNRAQEGIN